MPWAEEEVVGRLQFEYGSIRYEMQCVLYNLGAAQTRLAAALNRSPPLVSSSNSETEGTESPSNTALKMACSHLQCAAWAFQVFIKTLCRNNLVQPKVKLRYLMMEWYKNYKWNYVK